MKYKLDMAVVGYGFVGKAVHHGFDLDNNTVALIDPNLGTKVEDLYGEKLHVAFICVPTPMSDTGEINASIVREVSDKLFEHTDCLVVLKSTVTPDIVEELSYRYPGRFVYNPEFLTEANAERDFENATFNIFGGDTLPTAKVADYYAHCSKCKNAKPVFMTAVEASFVKYTINTFLSTKVTFFNQMKDLTERMDGVNFDKIVEGVSNDPRIGLSHMAVPGPDGRRGFGGACFPKDTSALYQCSGGEFDLLKKVLDINASYRLQYDLDDREKEQNVKFGD